MAKRVISAERQQKLDAAVASLVRIQNFDASTLARSGELGTLNFEAAVPHAQRLVDLYGQISVDVLDGVPVAILDSIKNVADATFNRFQQAVAFNVEGQNPKGTRDNFVAQVENDYDPLWQQLQVVIGYSVRRSMDFAALEREARGHMQSVQDSANKLKAELDARKKEADDALDAIRKVAAEQGVSQQAIYFKEEAEVHEKAAAIWYARTYKTTIGLGLYAVTTLFLHKIKVIAPTNGFEAVQLVVGRILVFATIASFVLLSARNFLAHRHNAVVNKHRQNALVTYKALVEAAKDAANKEVILTKAAECIFSQQATGFGKEERADGGAFSMVNVAGGMKPPSGT